MAKSIELFTPVLQGAEVALVVLRSVEVQPCGVASESVTNYPSRQEHMFECKFGIGEGACSIVDLEGGSISHRSPGACASGAASVNGCRWPARKLRPVGALVRQCERNGTALQCDRHSSNPLVLRCGSAVHREAPPVPGTGMCHRVNSDVECMRKP